MRIQKQHPNSLLSQEIGFRKLRDIFSYKLRACHSKCMSLKLISIRIRRMVVEWKKVEELKERNWKKRNLRETN